MEGRSSRTRTKQEEGQFQQCRVKGQIARDPGPEDEALLVKITGVKLPGFGPRLQH